MVKLAYQLAYQLALKSPAIREVFNFIESSGSHGF